MENNHSREDIEQKLKNLQKKYEKQLHDCKIYRKEMEFIHKNLPDIIFKLDTKGKITFINDAVKRYGYKTSDVIGRDILEFVHPDDLKDVKMRLHQRRTGDRATRDLELRLFTRFGDEKIFKARSGMENSFLVTTEGLYDLDQMPVTKQPDTHTHFLGTEGIARDITEQKRAENELRMSERKYRIISDFTNDSEYWINPQGELIYQSPSIEKITGYKKEEFYNNHPDLFISLIHPDDREEFKTKLLGTDKGTMDATIFRIITKSGKTRWLEHISQMVYSDEGEYLGIRGSGRDITDRKQIEEALKGSKEKLQKFMASSTSAFFLLDANLNVLEINKSGLALLPYSQKKENVCGKNILEIAPSLKETGRYDKYLQVIKTGKSVFFKDIVPDPVFGDVYFDVRAFKVGEGLGMVIEDVTDRKLAEKEISDLLREKEILLKEVHHRVKNNMNVIRNLLIMHSDTLDIPEAETVFHDAVARIESMVVLYDKIYRSESYREVSIKNYCSKLIDEICDIFPNRHHIKIEKQIDDFQISSKILFYVGILLNELITNSLKYAFTGKKDGLIKISASIKNNQVTIKVQDNGIGIPNFQNEENKKGFGLMLIDMLSDQIGGEYTIERNKGTTWIINFTL